jgi:hypothetical protein
MPPTKYWDVTLGFHDSRGTYCTVGTHILFEDCGTAEHAIELCREWRHVTEALTMISAELRGG